MEKLIKIQAELKAPKDQTNNFAGYKYRNVEDILEAAKPYLEREGCTLTLSDEIFLIGDRYYIQATATISDGNESVSTTAFAREAESKKGLDPAQVTGGASSYARKYALGGLLLVDNSSLDPDTMQPEEEKPRTEKPKAEKPKAERPRASNLIDDHERHRLGELCKEYKIDKGWLAEQVGVKNGMMTKPQYAKAIGIINGIIEEKEKE